MTMFRTVVDIPDSRHKTGYETLSFWMGSCFTENIGSRLKELKFPAVVNPFGVLYNPESIRNSLNILMENRIFTRKDLHYGNDLWYSFYHHSSFSHPDRDICLQRINESTCRSSAYLKEAKLLFITFGTARAYRHTGSGLIVSNNHKLPHNMFSQVLLEVDDIVDSYKALIGDLMKYNPELKLVFTLSPIRHWKDGPTDNQISKATLLLAIAGLAEMFENVNYFPAYEIVMDELRDYRFYAEDMLHINKQGVDYIWKRFMESFVSKDASGVIKKVSSITQGIEHRPFNPHTEKHRLFLYGLLRRIDEVEKSVPGIDFSAERSEIHSRLENPI